MKDLDPLVSIVTPVYNGSKHLEELICSVLEQDYTTIEHIIIDDGSNDNGAAVAILKRYPHLRWWSRPNKGQYASMNEGLAAAKGELVTFICADDKYAARDAVTAAVRLWLDSGRCDAVYGETDNITEDGKPLRKLGPRSGPLWMMRYNSCVMSHCSLFVRRDVLINRSLWFDEYYTFWADGDWIMRMIEGGCRFRRLRRPIALYRQHPQQLSRTSLSPAQLAVCRHLAARYRGYSLIGWTVKQWVRLVILKNLLSYRGIAGSFRVVRARLSVVRPGGQNGSAVPWVE